MRRREFITLLGGAAARVAVCGASAERPLSADRRAHGYAETDSEANALLGEFTRALSEFGWIERQNLRLDVRWAPAKTDLMHTFAKELVSLQPDLILTQIDTGNRCRKTRNYHYPNCFCGRRIRSALDLLQVSPAPAATSLGSARSKDRLLING
jgi:hypothetical protein